MDARSVAFHSGPLDAYDGTSPVPLMRCFGGFALGILTYRAARLRAVTELLSRDWAGVGVLGVLVLMLGGGARDLVVAALFPLLILCLSTNQGIPARLFSHPIIFCLGNLSYAIYLLHPLFQGPAQPLTAALAKIVPHAAAVVLAAALITGALLGTAAAANAWIERPGRALLRCIEPRMALGRS